jgi:hypothetical protein
VKENPRTGSLLPVLGHYEIPKFLFVFLHQVGEVVEAIPFLAHGLTRHDVHVLGEEHATTCPLAHRLYKGVLDLREVPALRDGIRILDDLRSLDEEERIVAGVGGGREDDAPLVVVAVLRLLKPGRTLVGNPVAKVPALDLTLGLCIHHFVFVLRDAEVSEHAFREGLGTDVHSHRPGVERGLEVIKHHAHDHAAHVHATVLLGVHPRHGLKNLVVDDEAVLLHHGVGNRIVGRLRGKVDSVGLTIGDDHHGGNLNVVVHDPLLDELGGDHHGLHGGSATKRDDATAASVIRDIGFVEEGKQLLTIRSGVPRRGEAVEVRGVVGNAVGLLVHDLGLQDVQVRRIVVVVGTATSNLRVDDFPAGTDDIGGGESVDLKGNLRLLAEPHQLENLKNAVPKNVGHRTGEINHKEDSVVLAVLLDDLRQEDIVVGAVLVEAVKVQHPRLLGTLAANLVRSLATLKLRDQLANERIGLADKLPVVINVHRSLRAIAGSRVVDGPLVLVESVGGAEDERRNVLHRGDRDGRGGESLALLAGQRGGSVHETHAVSRLRVLAFPLLLLLAVVASLLLLRLLLHALTHLVHQGMLVESLRQRESIIERHDGINHVRDLLLLRGEVDREEAGESPLEVEVHAVHQARLLKVHLAELEQVAVDDLLVAQEEVPASPRILLLHQLLNANVLNDVGDVVEQLDDVAILLRLRQEFHAAGLRSPQGVADLMGDEHGLKGVGDIPHGHDEVATINVERCGGSLRVERHRKVLGCESAGENGERGVHVGSIAQARGVCVVKDRKILNFFDVR